MKLRKNTPLKIVNPYENPWFYLQGDEGGVVGEDDDGVDDLEADDGVDGLEPPLLDPVWDRDHYTLQTLGRDHSPFSNSSGMTNSGTWNAHQNH